MENAVYVLLSIIGLGFLVLIHELGHYFMARRARMTVEVFSIGFGLKITSWKWHGVSWQLCWLPFGGYVRIAGMEKKGRLEPHQIHDGFYAKKPWERIKVAFMGPLVNFVFALIAFSIIWSLGGRKEPFAKHTQIVGWVDADSNFAKQGLEPGDLIETYDGHPFKGFQDFMLSSVLKPKLFSVQCEQIDYYSGIRKNLSLEIDPKSDLRGLEHIAVMPAQYLIYDANYKGINETVRPGAPMAESGIQSGDRIAWVNGELVFSMMQLSEIINQSKVMVTVQRGSETLLAQIPRLKVSDIRFQQEQRDEIDDWRHAASLKQRLPDLFYIPYLIGNDLRVDSSLAYLDEGSEPQNAFAPSDARSRFSIPLEYRDRILAVDGLPVHNVEEFLSALQTPKCLIIAERGGFSQALSSEKADQALIDDFNSSEILSMIHSIGTENSIPNAGNYVLLKPVAPVQIDQFPLTEEEREQRNVAIAKRKDEIQAIDNPEMRSAAMRELQKGESRLMLGIRLHDREIIYNPKPMALMGDVMVQTWNTFSHLFTGSLSPKWIAGPVGIMQIMHHGWSLGFKEALYWMGLISLNLAVLNLLPIPVFDGGHICFSVYEAVTKKRIKAKTMEKLVLPFVVLLILFFIYLTYNDLLRLVQGFFR